MVPVTFSPDEDEDDAALATGASDGMMALCQRLFPDEWIDVACARADRNMTKAEWNQYRPGAPYERTCDAFTEPE